MGIAGDTPTVEVQGMIFPADCAEISGFGGTYEEGCRRMMIAGYIFLRMSGAEPEVGHYEGITGIDKNMNKDAEELEKAMMAAPIVLDGRETTCGDEATGAMVQYAKIHAIRAQPS